MRHLSDYCPHAPRNKSDLFDAEIYSLVGRFSIRILDFQSTLDGIVAYAILFSLLFLSTLAGTPVVGLTEAYRHSLLVAGTVAALTLAIIFVYSKYLSRNHLSFQLANAKRSLLASFSALAIWSIAWVLFGELSGSYRLNLEPTRAGLVSLAFIVGLLDGVVVFAFCTNRFVRGVGRTAGILISSVLGWLLFLAVSLDFALYLLPIVVVLAYVDARTESPIGPTITIGLLMAFFYVYFGVSAWFLGTKQAGYWLMTAVSVASAFVAAFSLRRVPLGGISYGESSKV
jgi:hypothetical protein